MTNKKNCISMVLVLTVVFLIVSSSFVVANGEIYNHKELRAELGITNEELTTDSDSEIIIHGYKKLGNEICNKLIGMFGFVLITESGDVLACRDKVGIKPLYMGKSVKLL